MLNLATLKRQHQEIREILSEIKLGLNNTNLNNEASQLATKISILAGKLRIHLSTEDQCMYPQLLKSDNMELRKTAQGYISEMGHISNVFMDYKDRFNTKTKITGNSRAFIEESNRVFEILEDRIMKEDLSLYTII